MTRYRVHGLVVESQIPLPELAPADMEPTDVQIEFGPVTLEGDRLQPLEGGSGFAIEEVARFAVFSGNRIRVDPAPGADPRNIRLYLLGSALGLVLHQRGLLPIHANSVVVGERAALLMGRSGAGKSTLAAWFHDRGLCVLGDDVSVIRTDGADALVGAGPQRLRLRPDSLARGGRTSEGLAPSYVGDPDFEKYDLPVPSAIAGQVPVVAIYAIEDGEALRILPLHGAAAVDALFANTYRGAFVGDVAEPRQHWESCLNLAERVPLYRLIRPKCFDALDQLGESILAHILEIARDRTALKMR